MIIVGLVLNYFFLWSDFPDIFLVCERGNSLFVNSLFVNEGEILFSPPFLRELFSSLVK